MRPYPAPLLTRMKAESWGLQTPSQGGLRCRTCCGRRRQPLRQTGVKARPASSPPSPRLTFLELQALQVRPPPCLALGEQCSALRGEVARGANQSPGRAASSSREAWALPGAPWRWQPEAWGHRPWVPSTGGAAQLPGVSPSIRPQEGMCCHTHIPQR